MKWTQRNSFDGVNNGLFSNVHAGFSSIIFHTIIQTTLWPANYESDTDIFAARRNASNNQ
jgi:hypothetical protein